MSQSSWLVAGMVPGIERQPRKKLEPNPERLLSLLHRWRDEAVEAGRKITRIALAFEAGRDGFWLARWLRARGVEADSARGAVALIPRGHCRSSVAMRATTGRAIFNTTGRARMLLCFQSRSGYPTWRGLFQDSWPAMPVRRDLVLRCRRMIQCEPKRPARSTAPAGSCVASEH